MYFIRQIQNGAFSEIFVFILIPHIKENLRIFKTMTYSTPDTYLEPSQRFKIEFFEKSS